MSLILNSNLRQLNELYGAGLTQLSTQELDKSVPMELTTLLKKKPPCDNFFFDIATGAWLYAGFFFVKNYVKNLHNPDGSANKVTERICAILSLKQNMKRFLLTGHVDHGKSTLGGQLLYQCGAVNSREVEKTFRQAEQDKMTSFRWARLLDINREEQERGVTIECNETEFEFRNNKYKLIDTPGHRLYIRHLIEAIYRNSSDALADQTKVVGVLVVSSIPRELNASISSGQIKEYILLLRAIGVDSIVVAINKLDKFGWSAETRTAFESAKASLAPFLKLSRFKKTAFAACSGLEGVGIVGSNPLFSDIPPLIDSINKLAQSTVARTVSTISDHNSDSRPVKRFAADIFVLNCGVFSRGYTGVVHMAQGEYNFSVEKLYKVTSNNFKQRERARFIKTGNKGHVILSLDKPVVVNNRDPIILRNNDQTIAYGIVSQQ